MVFQNKKTHCEVAGKIQAIPGFLEVYAHYYGEDNESQKGERMTHTCLCEDRLYHNVLINDYSVQHSYYSYCNISACDDYFTCPASLSNFSHFEANIVTEKKKMIGNKEGVIIK